MTTDWTGLDTEAVYRKGQRRLYFLSKLRSFTVCCKMLHILPFCTVFLSAICWGSSLRASDTKKPWSL